MKTIIYKLRTNYLAVLAGLFFLTSCNKDLEQFAAIPTPVYPTGTGVAATIAANPNDSLFNRLLVRTGFSAILNDLTKTFTIFAVDNAGMKVFVNGATSGIIPLTASDAVFSAFINGTNTTVFPPLTTPVNLSAVSAGGIVQYLTLGQKFTFSSFGTAFPNYPITSQIILDPTQPFVRMPIFPDGGTPYSYVNNIPVTGVDQAAANGIIHHTFTVVAPPSLLLRQMIAAEPTLSYFRTAILRADSGAVVKPNNDSTNFLNYLLGYGVTNMTVLTPNDAAFQTLIFGLVYSQVFAATGNAALATATANGAVAAGPAFLNTNNVSTALVKGIIAYHFLASNSTPVNTTGSYKPDIRVFSVNLPSTATFVKTLINSSIAVHPGVSALAVYAGPTTSSVTFTGYTISPLGVVSPTGTPATVVKKDNLAVNGIYHIIDKVLLPQ